METLAAGSRIPESKWVLKVQKVQKVQRGRYRRVAAMSFYNAAAGGSENHTTAPAARWKCTPSAAYGGVSPGGGDFSGSII